MPACVGHVASGCFLPEHVIRRKVRFEDAHEAIGDPTIRVAFVRDGVEWNVTLGSPHKIITEDA
jgi:alcohol dehydrogenase